MASNGIRDRVAIVGMGCTTFGEHWDKSVQRSPGGLVPGGAQLRQRAHRHGGRLLARHALLRAERPHALAPAQAQLQAGEPARELLRHRLRGLPQRLLRGGLRRLRHGHGHRRGEAEGLRHLRPPEHRRAGGRDPRGAHRPRHLQSLGARLRQEVRRGPGHLQGGDDPHRLEEPQERGAELARPVPEGSSQGRHRVLTPGGGCARHLRLLGRLRRLRGGGDRARRGRLQVHGQAALREGLVLHRRPRHRPHRSRLRLHHLPRGGGLGRGRVRPGRHQGPARRAGHGRGARLLHSHRAGADGGSRVLPARHRVEGSAQRGRSTSKASWR